MKTVSKYYTHYSTYQTRYARPLQSAPAPVLGGARLDQAPSTRNPAQMLQGEGHLMRDYRTCEAEVDPKMLILFKEADIIIYIVHGQNQTTPINNSGISCSCGKHRWLAFGVGIVQCHLNLLWYVIL